MRSILMGAVGALFVSGAAFADPVTFQNTTQVLGSDGHTYSYIGSDFDTTSLTASNSGSSVTLDFATNYAGNDTFNGVHVPYSDVFIGTVGGTGYNLGIALGYDGGLSAGIYTGIGSQTSAQSFGSQSSLVYGQGYFVNGVAQQSPTVLTSGTKLGGTVTSSFANDVLAITLSNLTSTELAIFKSQFSLFWGTAICGNGGFYIPEATTGGPGVAVPEPASWALLGLAVAGLAAYSFKRGRGASFA